MSEPNLGHKEMILQGDQPSAPKVTAWIIALPPHVHPSLCLQSLPWVSGKRGMPQRLQGILCSAQATRCIIHFM